MITRIFGLMGLLGCLAVVYNFEGTAFATGAFRIFHWPAMVLTGLGPIALVITCSDWTILFRTFRWVFGTSASRRQTKHEKEAVFLQRVGSLFYSEGAKAFDDLETKGVSDYVQKVIDRMAIRIPTTDIREMLEIERDRTHNHLFQCMGALGMGVRLAPSVGMLGTILGMVELLSSISDPSQIGSHMSLALLTTFYGLFFSLVVWTPLQQKVERVLEVELNGYNQVIRWLELLEKRKPTEYFADSAQIPSEETQEIRRVA